MSKSKNIDLHFAKMDGADMYRHFCHDFRSMNRKIFENIQYLDVGEMFRESHIVCFTEKQRLVGDLALEQSPDGVDVLWLKHLSVDDSFRQLGIGSHLLELCVKHIRSTKQQLHLSSYSEMGALHLSHVIGRTITANPDVVIVEKRRREEMRPFGT